MDSQLKASLMLVTEFRYKLHGGPTFDPVGRCSHVTLMHEKTLLIQRIKSVFSKVKANQKCSLLKANQNCFQKAKADQKRFFDALTTDQICFFDASSFFRREIGLDQKRFLMHQRHVTT